VLIANAENRFKEYKKEKDTLEIFKKDLGSFVRFFDFMSQIVDYNDKSLEKLSIYGRALRPMLREARVEDGVIDLDNVVLSHYRLSEIRRQDLKLREDSGEYRLSPVDEMGTAKPKDKKEELLSAIIERLNELFITDHLTEDDLVNYAYTIRDKVRENKLVMTQIANNTAEQAMLGDFPKAVDNAILDSSDAHENQKMQLLSDPAKIAKFAQVVFELLKES
jgi:type I restriction enzyme, R subunit